MIFHNHAYEIKYTER